jgi:multisubunit Na+/H+ antiporter MnhF subunit
MTSDAKTALFCCTILLVALAIEWTTHAPSAFSATMLALMGFIAGVTAAKWALAPEDEA